MSNALRADDRQLILDALNRQHADLRRNAASRLLTGEHYASLRRYHPGAGDRSAQLAAELAQVPCGDYVLISGRTRADAERDRATVRLRSVSCTTEDRGRAVSAAGRGPSCTAGPSWHGMRRPRPHATGRRGAEA